MKTRTTMPGSEMEALRGSIEKWRKIRDCEDADRGTDNCPLCIFYCNDCYNCIVGTATGLQYCQGTPYIDWCNHMVKDHGFSIMDVYQSVPGCETCARLAQAEIDFLASLGKTQNEV